MSYDASFSGSDASALLRTRLLDFLQTLDLDLGEAISDETPLMGSGLLDSLELLRLATWIEGEIGHALDPDGFDLQEEWKTVGSVLDHIQRHRSP